MWEVFLGEILGRARADSLPSHLGYSEEDWRLAWETLITVTSAINQEIVIKDYNIVNVFKFMQPIWFFYFRHTLVECVKLDYKPNR